MGTGVQVSLALRRSLPLLLAFLLTMLLLIDYFFAIPEVEPLSKTALSWTSIIAGFALMLGAVAVLTYHGRQIQRRKDVQRFYSAWTVIMFITFATIGIVLTPASTPYSLLYIYVLGSIVSTVNGLALFYFISAAYRGLRAKSLVALVATLSALFTFLHQAPVGPAIFPPFGMIGTWLWNVPALAGSRGIVIVGGLGLILLGIRAITGRERGFLR